MAKFNLSKETRNPFGQIRGLRVPLYLFFRLPIWDKTSADQNSICI